MTLLNQMELVEHFLKADPQCRDSDRRLIARVWIKTLKTFGVNLDTMSAKDLLKIIAGESMLPSSESIRRSRQKLQEQHASLRGEKYKFRQEGLEPSVRREVIDASERFTKTRKIAD